MILGVVGRVDRRVHGRVDDLIIVVVDDKDNRFGHDGDRSDNGEDMKVTRRKGEKAEGGGRGAFYICSA